MTEWIVYELRGQIYSCRTNLSKFIESVPKAVILYVGKENDEWWSKVKESRRL